VAARLRKRRPEIEQATLLRIRAVSALPRAGGPEYAEGLRGAVSAGLDYGLTAIERGEEAAPPIPEALLAQARLAARSGVSLDTVLRRYLAGHTLLDDFLIEEADRTEAAAPTELKRLLRSQAALIDRLLAAVSSAYAEAAEQRSRGTASRKAERIERLLAGELLDAPELGYDFDGWHLAAIAAGAGGEQRLRRLAACLDCRLLLCPRGERTCWAWFGSRRRLDPAVLLDNASRLAMAGHAVSIGEPGKSLAGWRLTHRQAAVALLVAQRRGGGAIRYGDVALLAAVLQDDLLASSLRRLYLEPLEGERDGGAALRETLRAYFAAQRNVTSAAAALALDRNTIARRLRRVDRLVGRSVVGPAASMEAALSLHEIDGGRGTADR
jgi:hypothetical protein